MVNLSSCGELLRQLFGDRLLLEGTELESLSKEGGHRPAGGHGPGAGPRGRVAAAYFQILQEDGTTLDVDDIVSARALLEGKSVLFCNPFTGT